MKKTLSAHIVLLFITMLLVYSSDTYSNGMSVTYQNAPWTSNGSNSFTVKNTTDKVLVLEGLRFTVPNVAGISFTTTSL